MLHHQYTIVSIGNRSRRVVRTLVLGIVALATSLSYSRPAAAQLCTIPPINDPTCPTNSGTIEQYMTCYRELFDDNVIPAFTAIAQCSHARAEVGIKGLLEAASAKVLQDITKSLAEIKAVLDDVNSPPNQCITALNAVDGALRDSITGEREAPDLDAYRRSRYSLASLTFFTNHLLVARENRAACDRPLQLTQKTLQHLLDLKLKHLDYCEILRQNADYESVSKIEDLGQYTSLEPAIDYGQFFNLSITINNQCGYFDAGGGGSGVTRNNQCTTGTIQYKQTLATLDGTLGWIVKHREMLAVVGLAVGIAAFGPYGVLVALGIELIISVIDFVTAQMAIDDLEDMIADKKRQLEASVAANLITEDEFNAKITARCEPWQSEVEHRYQLALSPLSVQAHIERINKYYVLSDQLHDWYNELFKWATTPGPGGTRFIDEVAELDLIAQQHEFDQRIFAARADQEIASRKNTLINIKGALTLMNCGNLTPLQKSATKSRLRAGVRNFNLVCSTTMDGLAVQPDQPIAFATGTATSDVVCAYKGFRNGVVSMVISNDSDFAANLTLRGKDDVVLAQLTNITSNTDFSQVDFPGFVCASESGQPFGTSAENQLATGTYPMRLQDNIFGFDKEDADGLRTSIQSLDSQLRFKVNTCTQQLGAPVSVPRPVDACGIPVTF